MLIKTLKYVIGSIILVILISLLNSCGKKIGIIHPDKCKEMKFITIDNIEINGYPDNLKSAWGKFYYSDHERFIEVKEVVCTRYGYWDEN